MNENIIEAAEAARSQILGGPWNGEYDANFILGFEVGAAWERDREPSEAVPALLDALDTAEARADRAEAAARTLGGIVEWQGRDIARIADAEHLVQDDGDADWGMIWDLAEERATRGAAAEAERDTALARIEKVRAALAPYAARDHDEACDGDAYCGTDVAEEALRALDGEVESS